MTEIVGFKDLKIGQRVKAKGKLQDDGTFLALEISVRLPKEHSTMNGPIQSIDYEKKTMHLLDRTVSLGNGVELIDMYGNDIAMEDLKPEVMVKIKGTYNGEGAFEASSVKIKETAGYEVEKVQGKIQKIDHDNNKLEIDGFKVTVTPKTMIEGI